jgi:hypothetical protein
MSYLPSDGSLSPDLSASIARIRAQFSPWLAVVATVPQDLSSDTILLDPSRVHMETL